MARRKLRVGDRVQAGKGEDFDTGRIVSIDAKTHVAVVAWDTLVMTPAPHGVRVRFEPASGQEG